MYGETDNGILGYMVDVRRDFHKYAETAWCEFRTTSRIASQLVGMGYKVLTGEEFIEQEHILGRNIDEAAEKSRALLQGAEKAWLDRMGSYTGCMAILDTGRPGPVKALRFDIDCNDVNEDLSAGHRPYDEGFSSVNPGSMHACAHDGHAAVGLALAMWLKKNESELTGSFKLIFQPAEEGVRGGYAVVKGENVDDVDYFLSLHLGLGYPTGTIVGGVTDFLGSSKFDLVYKGVGAHAGGEPNAGRNALLAGATAALGLHAIPPHRDGITRINVGVMKAGEGRNVVPSMAELKVETRGETRQLAQYVFERAMEVAKGAAVMYGVEVEGISQGEAPCSTSDKDFAELVVDASRGLAGVTERIMSGKMPGSDDASWMMEAVRSKGGKATYAIVGANLAAGHHNFRFDFDEKAMLIAYELLLSTVKAIDREYLEGRGKSRP
ncbi:MAG TPA: amidohydrolase [Bacillota bacterium]|nr:amidohydrolase [Bacillota bacterium]